MYQRITKDIYIIFTNYGTGYEQEDTAETMAEAQSLAREYRVTSCAPLVRIQKKRIKL